MCLAIMASSFDRGCALQSWPRVAVEERRFSAA